MKHDIMIPSNDLGFFPLSHRESDAYKAFRAAAATLTAKVCDFTASCGLKHFAPDTLITL